MSATKHIAIGLGVSAAIVGGMFLFLLPEIREMNQPEIAVIGPGEILTFSINGGETMTVGPKARKVIAVDEGTHQVVFTAPVSLEYEVTLQSGERWIAPGLSPQCYGKLDVSKSHYDAGTKGQVAPSLVEVREEVAPFELDKYHYLHPNKLPSSVEAGHSVWLFRSAPCEQLRKMAEKIAG